MTIQRGLPDRGDETDLCIVGAGPVGIALALACEAAGLSVLLLESGAPDATADRSELSAGHRVDALRHASPDLFACRALGGTSRLWGGRCVPFDPIDFEDRPHLPEARWPLGYDEIAGWHAAAAAFFGIGSGSFVATDGSLDMGEIETTRLERWAPRTDLGHRYAAKLKASQAIAVATETTVAALHLSEDGRRVACLDVIDPGGRRQIRPARVVLACGGLETTRLLLATQRARPASFGGTSGALGRYYMGHLSGRIAEIVLDDPRAVRAHDFFLDGQAMARRRFTVAPAGQRRERLQNIAFWIDNPAFHAAEHRSGLLSMVWLLMACRPIGRRLVSEAVRQSHRGPWPAPVWPHLRNILRTPAATIAGLVEIAAERYLARRRRPGFIVRNRGGRYALHYHAEHAPSALSHVRLSDQCDASGLPFLDIALSFDEQDARSVVRAHALLDEALRSSGHGRLAYAHEPEDRVSAVLAQARDGFHQTGTVRMSDDPGRSVVDRDCRVHGVHNLYIASSAVFPSSGQANPTFLAVALALRLATHLAQ